MSQEIEVTSVMMDAGVKVLWAAGITDDQVESDRLVVADIFRAMCAKAIQPSGADLEASTPTEGRK